MLIGENESGFIMGFSVTFIAVFRIKNLRYILVIGVNDGIAGGIYIFGPCISVPSTFFGE